MESSAEINFATGHVSASGSEEFVLQILTWAKQNKEEFAMSPPPASTMQTAGEEASASPNISKTELSEQFDDFSDVYAPKGDDVEILVDTSQGNTAETARRTVLLYLYGRKLLGLNETSHDDLRAVCEEHGCYDASNFATHMKGLKGKMTKDGSSRSYTATLTKPGEREAKAIAEKLQNDAVEA